MAPQATGKQQVETMGRLAQLSAAWLVGLSARTFRDTDAPRNADGTYDAQALVEWCRSRDDADPLLVGNGESPNLERYRAAKARLCELDVAEREGRLVDVNQFTAWWHGDVAGPLRRSIEILRSRFGSEAAALIENSLQASESVIESRNPVA